MKKEVLWKILLIAGILPFVIPVVLGLYRMRIESWTMVDWLVLYSFVYWPTYIIGLVLMAATVYKLTKSSKKEG